MFYRHAYAWYDEIRNPGHVVPRQLPCSVIQPDFMEIVVVGNRDYCFLGVLYLSAFSLLSQLTMLHALYFSTVLVSEAGLSQLKTCSYF
jgi:hypothetical protein